MKEQALWLYRQLTRRTRQRLLAELRAEGRLPLGILFYHRVADQHPNPWTISRDNFARHLDWLQANFQLVSLAEMQRRIRSAHCEQPTVSLTFDDGYAENADFAIPELVRRGLTATYFVATDFVRTGQPFPHDVAAGVPLPPNTMDQLRDFAASGIEIGAHTRSHCDVAKVNCPEQLRSELIGSVEDLQTWLERPIRYFAFPYGLPQNCSQAAVELLVEHGLSGFCSAYGSWNWPDSHGYHLKRIHGDPGIEKLRNWLTLDPRKLVDHVTLPFHEPCLTDDSCQAVPSGA